MSYVQSLVDKRVTPRHSHVYSGAAASKLPTKQDILAMCPVCHEKYVTAAEAEACAAQPYDAAGLEVGDLLILPGERFHASHFDAKQPHWVLTELMPDWNSTDHFEKHHHILPWWVVTAIHTHRENYRRHETIVTVSTLANGELMCGWNPANGNGHECMFKPGVPREEQRWATCQDGTQNPYWWNYSRGGKKMSDIILNSVPSDRLRAEAAELAAIGISTTNLL